MIRFITIGVVENGMYSEPCKSVGQTADDVKKLVAEFLKPGAEGCAKKEK